MCRLMGYVAPSETTLVEIAGAGFTEFAGLSAKHGDGWGVSSVDTSGKPTLILEPSRAKESAKFADVAASHSADAAILHLRWATSGLSIKEGNTHPFIYDGISFMHNGGVLPPESLDPFIDADLFAHMRGETDSEKYFFLIITEMRKFGLKEGILSAVRIIREKLVYSSINAMILTATDFYVVCEHNNERIPSGEGKDYYELFYRKDASGVLVASTGWDQTGWTNLPNHHILSVSRSSLTVETAII